MGTNSNLATSSQGAMMISCLTVAWERASKRDSQLLSEKQGQSGSRFVLLKLVVIRTGLRPNKSDVVQKCFEAPGLG